MQQVDGLGLLPLRVDGVQLTPGVAIGRAVLHEPRIAIQKVVAEDIGQELARFEGAAHGVREDIDRMLEAHDMQSGEQREILETFRMFIDDRGWLERVREAVSSGLTAEAGVQRAFDDVRARLGQSTDPYIRERLSDFQDLTNRLLLRLTGRAAVDPASLPDDMIVIARDMGPAELLDYDRSRLRGLVLEEGSAQSHVAIVAHALDIPVVGRASDVLARVEPGDPIVVDGDNAQVLVRPAEDVLQSIFDAIDARVQRRRKHAALRDLPSTTRDQVRISLNMNAGLLIDLQHLVEVGADGVGLYRTEIPFMVRSEFPMSMHRLGFMRACSIWPMAGPWYSARWTSAATRCCPMSAPSATTTRRWVGAPFVSASIGRRCCAVSFAPSFRQQMVGPCRSCFR